MAAIGPTYIIYLSRRKRLKNILQGMAGIIHNELFKVLALYKSFNSFKVMPTILPHTLNNTLPSVSVFNIKWPIPTHTMKT